MTFISKYLPAKIANWKEGHAVDTDTGQSIYYNGDYGEIRPKNILPAKLFMCSTDIKQGDKIMWIGPNVNKLKSFSIHTAKSSINSKNNGWVKVIGRIINRTGVEENKEYSEESFTVSCINFTDRECGCFKERNNSALSICSEHEMFVTIKLFNLKKISDTRFIGIIPADIWFKEVNFKYPVLPDDFVVASWSDYHDGEKSNIEGKTTIAIFRSIKNAELFFNSINHG